MAASAIEDEPLSLSTTQHTFDAQFHPREPLLAAATITGAVELHRFDLSEKTSELVRSLECHKESCRAARFLVGGSSGSKEAAAPRLATASASCFTAVTDIESGKKLWKAKLRAAGNTLIALDEQRFAVGDDDGGVALYDVRQKKAAVCYEENSDFISDFARGKDERTLCATSGDGTLAVYDLRKSGTKGLVAMSDFQDDEYLSLDIVRNGTKVVCGSQTGPLAIFSWGDFGDLKDRVRGHPMSVDALIKISEDGILTGSSDGKVRVVSIYSKELGNAVLGICADHGEYPIEQLTLSPCQEFFASVSHEQPAVRIWSLGMARRFLAGEVPGQAGAKEQDEGEPDSDDSDDSDAPKGKKKQPKKKRKKGGAIVGSGKTHAQRQAASSFFGGL